MKTEVGDNVAKISKVVLDYDQFCQSTICQGLAIKPLTKRLIHTLLLDLPPTPSLIADFGITSSAHYRALKDALFDHTEECSAGHDAQDEAVAEAKRNNALQRRIVALDTAYGNAAALNAFVSEHAPAHSDTVSFEPTDWDYLYGRVKEDS